MPLKSDLSQQIQGAAFFSSHFKCIPVYCVLAHTVLEFTFSSPFIPNVSRIRSLWDTKRIVMSYDIHGMMECALDVPCNFCSSVLVEMCVPVQI